MMIVRLKKFAFAASLAAMAAGFSPAFAEQDGVTSRDKVLRDPEIVALGNDKGDITIVEWFDYQCPYCKKLSPDLEKLVKEDGKVRLVLKDWPILGEPSPYAAQLTQAAKYQGKFKEAHDALMRHVGRLTNATIEETLTNAGIDVEKAKADLAAHKTEIDDLLKRNNDQAEGLGFNSTPSFIVGTFRVPGILTPEQFKLAIADARKLAKKTKGK
ncbi:MAG: DsbA family protein [Xanthobacteraceae bacterium]|nr:DsbA family protein [Xanthobacteraceae bacterium]